MATMMGVLRAVLVLLFTSAQSISGSSTVQRDILENIFSSALASNASSFHSLVTALRLDQQVSGVFPHDCFNSSGNYSALVNCLATQQKCLSSDDIEKLYSLDAASSISPRDVLSVSPALLYSILSCDQNSTLTLSLDDHAPVGGTPSSESAWGYGTLFVTLINMCALVGALVLPCMKLKSYKLVLIFMVSVAVGTLVGSALLFLIPEAFALVHDDNTGYIWKSTTVFGGAYLFFLIEKVMRIVNDRREDTSAKKKRDEMATQDFVTMSFRRKPIDNALPGKELHKIPHVDGLCSPSFQIPSCDNSPQSPGDDEFIPNGTGNQQLLLSNQNPSALADENGAAIQNGNGHGHSHSPSSRKQAGQEEGDVAPVAYMIIFGDALHNFIDGLSIGSAFTQSTMTGISVSVAVLCEELPHELGDFAILLNSGMPFRRAIMYNFLSACTCYLGLVIGILLGENTESHEWIFALAGGMFLYISLVDMMPEMNNAAETPEGKEFGTMRTFVMQNVGLLLGYAIMLVLALYGGAINFE